MGDRWPDGMGMIHAQVLVAKNHARVTYGDGLVVVERYEPRGDMIEWIEVSRGKSFVEAVMRAAEITGWTL